MRKFCATTGTTVALKGPVTRVCSGDTSAAKPGLPPATEPAVYHSLWGGPILSRGGSGDILAGLVAGQLALISAAAEKGGCPAGLIAAARGVVWHGLAADALARQSGQTSAAVTEMIPLLSEVLRDT